MIWLFALLIGCGGGDEDSATDGVLLPECYQAFKACGGDVKGAWTLRGVCDLGIEGAELGCESATFEIVEDRSAGSVDLRPDGSFTRVYDIDVDFTVSLPNSCLAGASCEGLADTSGLLTACVSAGESCDCTGTRIVANEASGTWFSSGNAILTNGDRRTDYCAEGAKADTVDDQGLRALWSR